MSNVEHEIEVTVKQCEETIAVGNALNRLYTNPDFKRVVLEGYFKDNAVRLVHALSEPAISHSAELKARTIGEMEGIGALRGYFDFIDRSAKQAAVTLEANNHELELVRREAEEAGE